MNDSEQHFSKTCTATPKDHQARLALGLTQFLQAIEGLGQANYRYGLISKHAGQIPLARLPVPLNEKPEQISYETLRGIVTDFEGRIKKAEATLADVDTTSVRMDFFIGRARLDLDGNKVLGEDETLWKVFSAINTGVNAEQGTGFFVGMDGADVHWLRGYCHVLMAMCDVVQLAQGNRDTNQLCVCISPALVANYNALRPTTNMGIRVMGSETDGESGRTRIHTVECVYCIPARVPLPSLTRWPEVVDDCLVLRRLNKNSFKFA